MLICISTGNPSYCFNSYRYLLFIPINTALMFLSYDQLVIYYYVPEAHQKCKILVIIIILIFY